MKRDIRCVVTLMLVLLGPIPARAADDRPDPRLGAIRTVFIEKTDQDEANDRVIGCLADKLKEHGALSAVDDKAKADAILTIDATIPNVAKRNLLMRKGAAVAKFSVTTPGGETLWKAENMFKKGSAIWGGKLDAACGLANGISKQLTEAIEKIKGTHR